MMALNSTPISIFFTTEFTSRSSSSSGSNLVVNWNDSVSNSTLLNTSSSTMVWTNPPFVYTSGLIILLACCSVICLLGCFGNVLVITVFFRWPRMRTVTNYYILNLALVDLLVVTFNIPISAVTEVMHANDRYTMGEGICKFATTLRYIVLNVSSLTLVAISLDRYVAVVYPFKRHPSKKMTVAILAIVWIICIAANSPLYFFLKIFKFGNNSPWAYCIIIWLPRRNEHIYVGITFALLIALPMAIMHYANVRIAYTTWHSGTMTDLSSSLAQNQQQSTQNKQHSRKRWRYTRSQSAKRRRISVSNTSSDPHGKKHVVTLVICIVLAFTICVMPLQIVKVLTYYGIIRETNSNRQSLRYMILFLRLLSYSNSMINPLLYVVFSTKFREGCKALRYGYRFSSQRSTSNARMTQHQSLSKRNSSHNQEHKHQKSSRKSSDKDTTTQDNQINQSQSLYSRRMKTNGNIQVSLKSKSFSSSLNSSTPSPINHKLTPKYANIELIPTRLQSPNTAVPTPIPLET